MRMASEPRVSVVVPAYNAERHLGATLDSILAQSLQEIEVLVVDDCSLDGTPALVHGAAEADPRVRYLRTSGNCGGPAGPRNLGIEAARADWVALCDADDLWHPDKLVLQLRCATEKQADLVCSQVRDFQGEEPPPHTTTPPSTAAEQITLAMMLTKNRVATSSVLCRRSLLRADGGFDTARSLVAVEDFDLWMRLLDTQQARLVRMPARLVDYRRLPGSLSRGKWKQLKRIRLVLHRHFDRRGRAWLFPLAMPALIAVYLATHVWNRVLRGRM